jgi:hypothetical protein
LRHNKVKKKATARGKEAPVCTLSMHVKPAR